MSKTVRQNNLGIGPTTLDRYVAREYLISYVIAIVVLLSLRILIDLFVMFDEFVETGQGGAPGSWQVIGNIAGYYIPKLFEYFRDFSGVIIMLAAAFSLTRMTRNNELTAILASGISLKRVIAPIVLLGFLLNMVMVLDQEIILPRMADKLARRHDEMTSLRTIENMFLPDCDGALLQARRYYPDSQSMSNVMIILRQKGQMVGYITANQAKNWNGKGWELIEGKRINLRNENNDEKELDKNSGSITGRAVEPVAFYPSELSPQYLWLCRNSAFKSLLSSSELSGLLRRNLRPIEYDETISEKYFRFTDPVINMVMLLLALPMLVSREKRGTKTAMFFAIAGAGGCFLVTFACKLLGGVGLAPLLSAWLPIIVFLPLSVLALDGIKT